MSSPAPEIRAARTLLEEAIAASTSGSRRHTRLSAALARLDEPVRIAVAGRIKAGKSTLLNALLGEQLAPTDAGECTRVVTWYLASDIPTVTVVTRFGQRLPRPVRRVEGRLSLDPGDTPLEDIDRIEVGWPSPILDEMTLVDTPGLASLSEEVSRRSTEALLPDDSTSPVDAIVYLLRHMHAADAEFLHDLGGDPELGAGPATTLGVLSRADEIGGGRIDSLISAERVAQRYRRNPSIRALCLDVVPVAGLMAECGRTLRQGEFDAIVELAGLGRGIREDLLVAAERFASTPLSGLTVATPDMRRLLVQRLGVFGIRLAIVLVRDGYGSASSLSDELLRRSGMVRLTDYISSQFTERAAGLKSRSALATLRTEMQGEVAEGDVGLAHRVHSALLGNHHSAEMLLLATLRASVPTNLADEAAWEAERIIGGYGLTPTTRLGLDDWAPVEEVRDAVFQQAARWRRLANDPAQDQHVRDTARTVIRSLEGVLASTRATSS